MNITIYKSVNKSIYLPFYTSEVAAGFPSSAEDHIETQLDLNELMIKHPAATFFVRVAGDSMKGAGIHSGDILVVDRSLEPSHGKIVIALLNGEFTVKKIYKNAKEKKIFLHAANKAYPPIEVREDMDFQVWGVVTYVIHRPE